MSILKNWSKQIEDAAKENGICLQNFMLLKSNRRDLGEFQINDCMTLAKTLHEAPTEIAKRLQEVIHSLDLFEEASIAGPGFINLRLKEDVLLEALNRFLEDIYYNVDKQEKKKIFMDYGGANIAKTLHVGHLRSANIGEANKRLAKFLGQDVLSDVHFGDIGRQSGMVISELKRRYPTLNYFKDSPQESYDPLPITEKELEEIYPKASLLAKQDEAVMEEVRLLTKALEEGNPNLTALWDAIKKLSVADIQNIYKRLHTEFDLWEGESDCYPYLKETIALLEKTGLLVESEGAKVIEVATNEDKAPMPPLLVLQSNGGTLYATRELATLLSRMKRFSPDEFWYFADNRQALYFEQVFRASYVTGLVPKTVKLSYYGFGTMNGKDGKPFKTRDGDVLSLTALLQKVEDAIEKRLSPEIEGEERTKIREQLTIATVKYADFLPNRMTDYIFDIEKFSDLEGKTGPYLLYSTIRMKSLLQKAKEDSVSFLKLKDDKDRNVALLALDFANILTHSYEEKSLHEIAEYLYQLTSSYNTFYQEHPILREADESYRKTWLALTELVYKINTALLTILGIEIPEKM